MLESAATRVTGFKARFAGVLFPGETLRSRIWQEPGKLTISATAVDREDAPVLGDVVLTYAD